MSHIFFFSYASENYDKELVAFFEDLCGEVAPLTKWGSAKDPHVSFRDQDNLPLMEKWAPNLMDALQNSAVMICVTSPTYFYKTFCGQEYYIFDQRRSAAAGVAGTAAAAANPPGVILPIVWTPADEFKTAFGDVQAKQGAFPPLYWQKGLRYLKKLSPEDYGKCVVLFAHAIVAASKEYPAIPPLANLHDFDQIPNAFNFGEWKDAAGPTGWLSGPSVANFVYAAALKTELDEPQGRYGSRASDWRPFLPPEPLTVADISKSAAKRNQLHYRELTVDATLETELKHSRDRKNLTLVLADPKTLPFPQYSTVGTFDRQNWEGTALLVLCDSNSGDWDGKLKATVRTTFPIVTQLKSPAFTAPVASLHDLEALLDTTFAALRGALTAAAAQSKAKSDEAPAHVSTKAEGSG